MLKFNVVSNYENILEHTIDKVFESFIIKMLLNPHRSVYKLLKQRNSVLCLCTKRKCLKMPCVRS